MNWLGESTDGERLAEFAGRLCYMSQHNPANRATREYLENIKKQGHGSVLEHANYSILLEGVSRSLTHELVRHRAGFAYSQLSQRYVDESEANFVIPPAIVGDEALERVWRTQVDQAQAAYVSLVAQLMERYGWVADKVHRRKMAREAARGRAAQRDRDENRRDGERARLADDARAAEQRGRRAGNSAHGGGDAAFAPARSAGVFLRLRDLHGGGSARGGEDLLPQGVRRNTTSSSPVKAILIASRSRRPKKTLREKNSDPILHIDACGTCLAPSRH